MYAICTFLTHTYVNNRIIVKGNKTDHEDTVLYEKSEIKLNCFAFTITARLIQKCILIKVETGNSNYCSEHNRINAVRYPTVSIGALVVRGIVCGSYRASRRA